MWIGGCPARGELECGVSKWRECDSARGCSCLQCARARTSPVGSRRVGGSQRLGRTGLPAGRAACRYYAVLSQVAKLESVTVRMLPPTNSQSGGSGLLLRDRPRQKKVGCREGCRVGWALGRWPCPETCEPGVDSCVVDMGNAWGDKLGGRDRLELFPCCYCVMSQWSPCRLRMPQLTGAVGTVGFSRV